MGRIPPSQPPIRAPRINLRGIVSVVVLLENRRQLSAKMHQLSITGGLLELARYVDERSKIAMAFHFGASLLQAKAELLFPMRGGMGYMQPFRFSAFAAGTRQTLERQIAGLIRPSLGPSQALGTHPPLFFLDSL
jgi:hypothetical protein